MMKLKYAHLHVTMKVDKGCRGIWYDESMRVRDASLNPLDLVAEGSSLRGCPNLKMSAHSHISSLHSINIA